MTNETFDKLLERAQQRQTNSLKSKSKEYATDSDKLHNFKRSAMVAGNHPAQALQGFLLKHLVWYLDALEKLEQGTLILTQEIIDEKFGDIQNYFILQEAVFVEFGLKS